jgi:hypothetical protein
MVWMMYGSCAPDYGFVVVLKKMDLFFAITAYVLSVRRHKRTVHAVRMAISLQTQKQ